MLCLLFVCLFVCVHVQDAHDSEVSALCFSPDGSYLATGGGDKIVKVWSWRPSQGGCGPFNDLILM